MDSKRLTLMACLTLAGCDDSVGATASTGNSSMETDSSTGDDLSTGNDPSTSDVDMTTGSGGETTASPVDPDAWECVLTPSVVALGTAAPDGTTAQQLIEEAEGIYEGLLRWQEQGFVQYGGELGTTALTVEIVYDGGEVRHVDAELVPFCGHDGPCGCLDSIEVDVTFRISTADGALDETWGATMRRNTQFEFGSTKDPTITFQFDASATLGTLSSNGFVTEDGVSVLDTSIDMRFEAGYAEGSVFVTAESDEVGFLGGGPIASMGALRELSSASCNAVGQSGACADLGCTQVMGQPQFLQGEDGCGCNPSANYCLAEPLTAGETTLYTREVTERGQTYDEVVAFEGSALLDDPWRACADAPEVEACAVCLATPPSCE